MSIQQFTANAHLLSELESINKKFGDQLTVLQSTQSSIEKTELEIKVQTRATLGILVLTAILVAIDLIAHVVGR
jgi:hypothetical protein